MDNRFYIPGAGFELLSRSLRNTSDGDRLNDEYYAVVLELLVNKTDSTSTKIKFYARMIESCNPMSKGTPHDFCMDPNEEESDLYSYYSRQHTLCEAPAEFSISVGCIVRIKLNKQINLNKTYIKTTTATCLEVYDKDTSTSLFPMTTAKALKKTESLVGLTQRNLTTATTNGNYTYPSNIRCFDFKGKKLYNGLMPEELLQTVEEYCNSVKDNEKYKCSPNVVKKDVFGRPVKLYKGIMRDYQIFCDTYYDKVTKKNVNYKLVVNESYRTLEYQVYMKNKHPDKAATPGESPHSWGLAIDIANTNIDENDRLIKPSEEEIKGMANQLQIVNIDKQKLRIKRAIQWKKSKVRKILISNDIARFKNPFNVASSMPESWHYEITIKDAFDVQKAGKCPVPGTETPQENTEGSEAGVAEGNAGPVEPSDGSPEGDVSEQEEAPVEETPPASDTTS